MRGPQKNSERTERTRKDKKGSAKLEPLRPQAKQSDIPRDDLAKFSSENPYPVLRIHKDGTVLFANKAGEPLLKARGSGVGRPAPAQWHQLVKKALSSSQVIREETKHEGRVFAFRAVPIAENAYVNFYGVDITERKQAEEALRETTQTLEAVIQASPLPIFAVDRERIVKTWNPAAERTFGWSAQEVIGRQYPAIPKEKMDEADALFSRAMESGLTEVETLRQRKDGSLMDVRISAAPLRDSRGNINGVMAVLTDITDRKRAELALRTSEEQHRTILQTTMDGFWLSDMQGRFLEVNEAYCQMSGYSREELLKMSIAQLEAAEIPEEVAQHIQKIVAQGTDRFETLHHRKDGSVFHVEVSTHFLPTEDGRLFCFFRDITERKKTEERLQEERKLLRMLIDHIPDKVYVKDRDSRFVLCNKAVLDYEGVKSESDIIGRTDFDLYDQARAQRLFDDEQELMRTGRSVINREKQCLDKAGNPSCILATKVLLRDNHGNMIGIVAIDRNITERKKAEEEIFRLNRVMETIADVNQSIFRIQDRDELLKKVCEIIVKYAYRMVWIGFCDEKNKMIVPQVQAGFEEGYLESVKITYNDSEHGMGPSGMAAKTAKPDVMRFIATDPRYEPWHAEAMKRGYRSSAAIPIFSKDKVIGALNVYADKEDAFGQEEVKLLEELAHDISTGLRGIDEQVRRRHAEQKLLEYQKQLKRLATRLTLTEERERRRIAGELHDQVNQSLALAKIKLDTLRAMPMPEPAEKVLTEIGDTLESVIDDTRSLIFSISSPILHELGFEAAVAEWLNEQVRDKHGIATEFQDDGQPKPLDDDVRVLLFRNVRELLINAIKHASAGKVRVCVRRTDGSIEVTVEDNGIGFDPMEARSMAAKRAEFGLFSIREGLEELGGRFEIESKPGAGCKATMIVPLKRKGMDDERNKATHQGNGN